MAAARPYPRFRRDLVVRRIVESGDASWTVHDPLRNGYYRHDALTHEVCELLDGARGADEVLDALHTRYPQYAFTAEWVEEVVSDLKRGGFLEETFTMNEIQRARAREARKKLAPGALKNLLNIQFGVIDPTRIFRVVYPVMRVVYHPLFLALAALAFLGAIGMLWERRDALLVGLTTVFTLRDSNLLGLIFLWTTLFLIVVAHEFGHGLCCMHFGGQPRRLGFMLFYLMPGMFCDVSDIYFFERRWHRAAVALAGGYVEVLCFTAATFVWVATQPDLLIHDIAYRVMLFSGVTGLIFNYNPLIKLDGYYVLMSWLDMPDLRERAFKHMGDWFQANVLRLPTSPERLTRREKRAFWIYGLCALTYSISYTWLMILFVRSLLVGHFQEAGFVVFAVFFAFFLKKWVVRAWSGARYLALERGGFVRRHWALALGAVAFVVAALVVPLPHRVKLEARVAPARTAFVVAPFDGRVEHVFARTGGLVRPGTVLAVVRPEDGGGAGVGGGAGGAGGDGDAASDARILALESERMQALARSAPGDPLAQADVPAARARSSAARERTHEGWLTSPVGGRVLTGDARRLAGRAVHAGEPVLAIGQLDSMHVLLYASEREVGDLAAGAACELRLRAEPGRSLRCRIASVDEAPARGAVVAEPVAELVDPERLATRFFARATLSPDEALGLRPGMTGVARVAARPLSLLQRLGRTYARLVRADFWL
jgi:putative peptide zinc metalloprotease protein